LRQAKSGFGKRQTSMQPFGSEAERKVLAILKVLSGSPEPLGSVTVARELENYGVFLSQRGVRYHLKITDERGFTLPMGHDGRTITEKGLEELKSAMAPEQMGFILEKLETLAFLTTFDAAKKTGKVPVNTSLIAEDRFAEALAVMKEAFAEGLCVSNLVAVAREGEKIGSVVVPAGKIGLATVCSVLINGVLLKAGVPVSSRFGGVLEVTALQPKRFVTIINYAGTSIDPSEQYIRAGMTDVRGAAKSGSGKILANFREVPAPARTLVAEKIAALREAGITGVLALGNVSEPLCEISLGLNRVGMVLLGGLNPIAAAAEAGIPIESHGESGLLEYPDLTPVEALPA
jgi:HTH-type transcriptional regulator, global nitrogen regulator NrpRI